MMESSIVSGALFFVMLLLFMVVYDSNPTIQRFVLRLLKRQVNSGKRQNEEESLLEKQEPAVVDQEGALKVPSVVELESRQQDESPGVVRRLISSVRSCARQKEHLKEEESSPFEKAKPVRKKGVRGIAGALSQMIPGDGGRDEEMETMLMDAISTVRNSLDELDSRVAQFETVTEKVGQFEEGLAKAGEDTQMVSEEMQDILGSIRVSIDGLEGRLNGLNTEVQEVKAREPEVAEPQVVESQTREIEIVDEETKNRVNRLEETVADINETLDLLPEKVQKAMSESKDAGKRVEVVSGNLQSTLGFNIRKTFRCESCGSSSFVASQVVCTKCGAGSWWGWWPAKESAEEEETDLEDKFDAELETELDLDEDEDEESEVGAEMIQSEDDQF